MKNVSIEPKNLCIGSPRKLSRATDRHDLVRSSVIQKLVAYETPTCNQPIRSSASSGKLALSVRGTWWSVNGTHDQWARCCLSAFALGNNFFEIKGTTNNCRTINEIRIHKPCRNPLTTITSPWQHYANVHNLTLNLSRKKNIY